MKKATCGVLGAVAVLLASHPARAQTPLSVDARVGAAIPFGDWGQLAKAGIEVRGGVEVHGSSVFGAYAGYSWARFDTEDALAAGHWTEQGFDGGVKVRVPLPAGGPLTPFLRAGVVVHKLSASDVTGTITGDYKTGAEFGAGAEFLVRPNITIIPQGSYSQFDPGAATFDVVDMHLGVAVSIRI